VQPHSWLGDHACNDFDTGLDAPQSPSDIGPSGNVEDFDTDNCLLDDPAHQNPNSFDMPPGDVEDLGLRDTIHRDDLRTRWNS